MLKRIKKIGYTSLTLVSVAIVLCDLYVRVLGGKELTLIEAAKATPQEAIMSVYISTDSQTWTRLEKLGILENRLIEQKINGWITKLADLEDVSYQEDIQPWIGNIMLAFLPTESALSTARNENLLLIVGVKNKLKAFNFASTIERQRDRQMQAINYKDVPIVETTNSDRQTLFLAIINHQLLVSSGLRTLELAIDTLQGDPSLASTNAQFFLADKPDRIAHVYIPEYSQAIKRTLIADKISGTALEQLKVKSVVLGVGIGETEICFWTTAKLNLSKHREQPEQTSQAVKGELPLNDSAGRTLADLDAGETTARESDRLDVTECTIGLPQAELGLLIGPLLNSLQKLHHPKDANVLEIDDDEE